MPAAPSTVKAAISTLPFIATFLLATVIAYRKVYPLLLAQTEQSSRHKKVVLNTPSEPSTQNVARIIAALTFSSTLGLSSVLTELLLCEISNSFNPTAQGIALRLTTVGLLSLLVVAIPLLGIYSVVSRSGYQLRAENRGKRRLAWLLELTGYAVFLCAFWTIGALLPQSTNLRDTLKEKQNVFQACLDRLGITGIALMALLSGFASVSAIWQSFGPKSTLVSESDIARKQTGLDATLDMLREKKARLVQVERILAQQESSKKSFFSRTITSLRGGNVEQMEKQTLELEISGLTTMADSLGSSLTVLRSRYSEQQKRTTQLGRLMLGFQFVFSIYCIYRIATTVWAITRRLVVYNTTTASSSTSTTTDPITSAIALVARHIYPALDRASWAAQLSLLLSAAMLLLSFSAVTQTFHLLSRLFPAILHATTRANFALLISQISGMYVISSALMLRGMMPHEVGGVINSALGSGMLDPAWVQRWFDGFFMASVAITAVGIFVGRALGGPSDDAAGEIDRDIELGKQS